MSIFDGNTGHPGGKQGGDKGPLPLICNISTKTIRPHNPAISGSMLQNGVSVRRPKIDGLLYCSALADFGYGRPLQVALSKQKTHRESCNGPDQELQTAT